MREIRSTNALAREELGESTVEAAVEEAGTGTMTGKNTKE